jgi:hypothetical protein
MRTISLDLRERILASYDQKEGNREEIAGRFRVSLGMVKKLLQQRRRTGDIAPPAPVFRSQAAHCGLASAADADFAGKEAGPDLGGIAPGHAAGLYLACHPLRSGEDGADI